MGRYKFKNFIQESPDLIILDDGTEVKYFDAKNNIVFYVFDDIYIFLQSYKKSKKLIITKNDKIILYLIDKNRSGLTVHGVTPSIVANYIYYKKRNDDDFGEKYKVIIDTEDDLRFIQSKLNVADFEQMTGRIFVDNKIAAVRGNKINPEKLKQVFNKIVNKLDCPKIDDSWFFEKISERGKETKSSYKKLAKTNDVKKPKIMFNKAANPFPELIMDRDWRDAIRILGSGFVDNIKLAYIQMNDE